MHYTNKESVTRKSQHGWTEHVTDWQPNLSGKKTLQIQVSGTFQPIGGGGLRLVGRGGRVCGPAVVTFYKLGEKMLIILRKINYDKNILNLFSSELPENLFLNSLYLWFRLFMSPSSVLLWVRRRSLRLIMVCLLLACLREPSNPTNVRSVPEERRGRWTRG